MGQHHCSGSSLQFQATRTAMLVHEFVESVQLSLHLERWNGDYARKTSSSTYVPAVQDGPSRAGSGIGTPPE